MTFGMLYFVEFVYFFCDKNKNNSSAARRPVSVLKRNVQLTLKTLN